jgi:hypothetical protein
MPPLKGSNSLTESQATDHALAAGFISVSSRPGDPLDPETTRAAILWRSSASGGVGMGQRSRVASAIGVGKAAGNPKAA